jgi:Tol biopolymer transport system component
VKKRKFLIVILSFSAAVLASLLVFSHVYLAGEEAGSAYQSGTLAEGKGKIAYVVNGEGLQSLILADEKTGEAITLLNTHHDEELTDLEFDSSGKKMTYLVNSTDKSSLYSIDIDTLKTEELMTSKAPVPDTAEGEGKIYFVKGEFQHEDQDGNPFHYYDLYSYELKTGKSERLTEKNAFYISSLIYDQQNNRLYFNMHHSESGDPFEAAQSIYELSLSDFSMKKIDTGMRDVFEMTHSPERNELVFKGIANPESASTFKYELFSFNLENKETKRLTFLEAYSADPVFSKSGQEVYFAYNDKIPGRNDAGYELYKLNRENLDVEKTTIQFNMDQGD